MKPLSGKRIMITRPEHQSGGLKRKLQALGATVFTVPVVQIASPQDLGLFQEALRGLDRYDWVVLTSTNGVEAVRTQMKDLGISAAMLSDRKIAAIGPATARAVAEAFRTPDLVPDEFVSEALATALPDVRGLRFLLARADLARRDLAETLREMGAEVDEVAAYRIVRSPDSELPQDAPDAITFTSSEIARATFELLNRHGKGDWMGQASLVCIGPITAETVRELGFEPATIAARYDTDGLVAALVDRLNRETAHA